jgi:hypothetical protein
MSKKFPGGSQVFVVIIPEQQNDNGHYSMQDYTSPPDVEAAPHQV